MYPAVRFRLCLIDSNSHSMAPSYLSDPATAAPVLRLGRAQLWFGCILYCYCLTLTLMALISGEWIASLTTINNLSCLACPSPTAEQGKDAYQRDLLITGTVLGAVGYFSIAMRWLEAFERFPGLKLLGMACLAAVVALDFTAHFSYRAEYGSHPVGDSNGALFFSTGYAYAEIAAVYGCLALALLAWHEATEYHVRRLMRQRRAQRRLAAERSQPLDVNAAAKQPQPQQQQQQQPDSPVSPSSPSSPSSPASATEQRGFWNTSAQQLSLAPPRPPPPPPSPSSSPVVRALQWCVACVYTLPSSALERDSVLLKFAWKDQLSPMQRRLVLGVNAFFLLLYLGGLVISSIEGWALSDGVNYILSAWCTLGYGLYTPITTGGRIFMYCYWPIGFLVISSTSTTLWRVVLFRLDRSFRKTSERLSGRAGYAQRSEHVLGAPPASAARIGDAQQKRPEDESKGLELTAEHSAHDHPHYPALKDIMFNSPVAAAHRSSIEREAAPPRASANSERDRALQLPADHSHTMPPLHDVPLSALPPSAGRRKSAAGRPVGASYRLSSGNTLTVYEEPRHRPPPSIADVFAPLRDAPLKPTAGPAAPLSSSAPSPLSIVPPPDVNGSRPGTAHDEHRVDVPVSAAASSPGTAATASAVSAQPMVTFTPFASAALASATYRPTGQSPLLPQLAPQLLKLSIAVLAVICWICIAGGVFVWSESGVYDYWDCQWSAFNLLTTISVGSIATPFSTDTSAFFVWYLLLGVGTLAYCFALIAQMAFIAFDQRQARQQRRLGHSKHSSQQGLGQQQSYSSDSSHRPPPADAESAFVRHAQELDRFILDLVHRQDGRHASSAEAEAAQRAFVRSPVLVVDGRADGGEHMELPLQGITTLLRYHMAFQAFEKARTEGRRRAEERRAQRRKRKEEKGSAAPVQQGDVVVSTPAEAIPPAEDVSHGGSAAQSESSQGEDSHEHDDNDELFDWSNTVEWIAQAEEDDPAPPAGTAINTKSVQSPSQ